MSVSFLLVELVSWHSQWGVPCPAQTEGWGQEGGADGARKWDGLGAFFLGARCSKSSEFCSTEKQLGKAGGNSQGPRGAAYE